MKNDTFKSFDNACMSGDLSAVKTMLESTKFDAGQLNSSLRHAAYYTGPSRDIREDVIDELIEHGAKVDWADHGLDTITNAFNQQSPYLLKMILNACDGDKEKLTAALENIKRKKDAQWAVDLIETRIIGKFHIGF